MSVDPVRLGLLLIGPIRLALGIAWLLKARAAGGSTGGTLLAFAPGAFAMAFLVTNDPRARFRGPALSRPANGDPAPPLALADRQAHAGVPKEAPARRGLLRDDATPLHLRGGDQRDSAEVAVSRSDAPLCG
jgi:hypothetical protein